MITKELADIITLYDTLLGRVRILKAQCEIIYPNDNSNPGSVRITFPESGFAYNFCTIEQALYCLQGRIDAAMEQEYLTTRINKEEKAQSNDHGRIS